MSRCFCDCVSASMRTSLADRVQMKARAGDHVERGVDGTELGVEVLDPPAFRMEGGVRGDHAGDAPADLGGLLVDHRDLVCLELGGVRADRAAYKQRNTVAR